VVIGVGFMLQLRQSIAAIVYCLVNDPRRMSHYSCIFVTDQDIGINVELEAGLPLNANSGMKGDCRYCQNSSNTQRKVAPYYAVPR
jgi:hypothetical protein